MAARKTQYVSVGRSALQHVPLIVVLVVVGAVLGVAGGVAKAPVYKADARLIVGKTADLSNVAAVAGLATAGNTIAADYSRVVGTAAVSDDVRHRLGYAPAGTLSASPIPGSPVISLEATGSSPAAATALANAASAALVDSVNKINQQTAAANQSLVQSYRAAAQVLEQDNVQVQSLQSQIGVAQADYNSSPTTSRGAALTGLQNQLVSALAAVDTAKLQTNALASQYQAAATPDQQASKTITGLGAAATLGSNRNSNVEIGGLIGVVAGLVVGLAVASLLDLRRTKRAPESS